MLSQPQDGWTIFRLGEKTEYRLSYLTDVACDWLDRAIYGLETLDVFSVHGFSEPGRMICTVSYWNCYTIFEGDSDSEVCREVYTCHISMLSFCRQLAADIGDHLDAWVHWDDEPLEEAEDPEAAARERRAMLQGKLDRLNRLLDEHEEDFAEDGGFF